MQADPSKSVQRCRELRRRAEEELRSLGEGNLHPSSGKEVCSSCKGVYFSFDNPDKVFFYDCESFFKRTTFLMISTRSVTYVPTPVKAS